MMTMIRRLSKPLGLLAVIGGTLAVAITSLGASAAPASAAIYPCFSQIPGAAGIPPWGFHTGQPLAGQAGSYARAVGNINLSTNWINGTICQVNLQPGQTPRLIMISPGPKILAHSHTAVMWGYPGNLVKTKIKVVSSNDLACKVGTAGTMTMFGSYNGVRSDSIQFKFAKTCKDHNHLYHGPQVNAQVPPA